MERREMKTEKNFRKIYDNIDGSFFITMRLEKKLQDKNFRDSKCTVTTSTKEIKVRKWKENIKIHLPLNSKKMLLTRTFREKLVFH